MEMTCPRCGRTLELNADNWYRNKARKSGFANWCKPCSLNYSNQSLKGIPASLIVAEKDLPRQGIPNVDIELNHNYKFIIPTHENNIKGNIFQGEAIQITTRHITFRHNLGYKETFLKWDLNNFNIKEV